MWRDDAEEILQKNISFTQNPNKKGVLLHVGYISGLKLPPVKALELWNLPKESEDYLDACILREKEMWRQRKNLQDDTIPCMKPYFGIAEHSAFVGGKVSYGGNTSYHHNPIETWDDFDKLSLSEDNENFKMLLRSMEYLKKQGQKQGFFAMLRGGEAPMDMANALRGNELFTDFYDEEENVHRLLNFCLDAARWTFSHQLDIVGTLQGGVLSGLGVWLPEKSIGHLSEDASCMCSTNFYNDFGKSYTQKLLKDYHCGLFHVHTMGRHILPLIASIEKAKFIQLTYDPNQPTPIEVYKEYQQELKDKTVVVSMLPSEIEENMEFLAQRKTIIELQETTLQEAINVAKLLLPLR